MTIRNYHGTPRGVQGLVKGGGSLPRGRVQEGGKSKEFGGCIRTGRFIQETGHRLTRKKNSTTREGHPSLGRTITKGRTSFRQHNLKHIFIKYKVT